MSILGKVLSAPVSGPLSGLVGIARLIDDQLKKELYDEDKVRGSLAELELMLDLKEISLEEYEEQEEQLLGRLKEIREMKANGEI
ncbi:gas vesicle protein GvpG [Flexibacterium corallicola]|uniref:gas vesicle protein GvpG n=1 Tax=Flexibacterium corallicola TaxID=3037259 RepID=UPI00286F48FF|nr:gas vesicle protein GvpG [Pseudovibrio sp. M1P-2-3]